MKNNNLGYGVLLQTHTVPNADVVETRLLLYVIDGIQSFFLSWSALAQLEAIPECFLAVPDSTIPSVVTVESALDLDGYVGPLAECGCPL